VYCRRFPQNKELCDYVLAIPLGAGLELR